MADKLSRYRGVPATAEPDAAGRIVAGVDIRLLPPTTGTFRHTVDAGDRLDHLAAAFYGRPTQYWRICDANPEVLSPLELLDDDPVITTRLPVTVAGVPPWAALRGALTALVGVEDVAVVEEFSLHADRVEVDGRPVQIVVERPDRAVVVRHNRFTVRVQDLVRVVGEAGFAVGPVGTVGRLGQPIVIPPATAG
jgi:hypothetical protein